MPERNLFQIFISRLEKVQIPYFVTGAVASIIYGEPRLTHDIDLVVELDDEKVEDIIDAFPADEFYCPPIEVIKLEIKRPYRGHFNLIHQETGFKADIYLFGQDKLHVWAMSKRRRYETEEGPIWLAPPEYVILRKLEYYREGKSEKHLNDIRNIMEVSSEIINKEVLLQKIGTYGLEEEWENVFESSEG